MSSDLYAFVFRGLLTEEALDKTGRLRRFGLSAHLDAEIANRLPIDAFDEDLVSRAQRMAVVYVSIAAFENSVREFVSKVLLEKIGADWWTKGVSEKIRTKAETRREEESKIRWHTPRGDEPINYTEFGDLASIAGQNWPLFDDYLQSQDWMRQIISTVERSRNVIMHSGELGLQDVERIATAIRDWIRQVGA
jgi:HEPN superfamily Swt1-like protein